MADYCQAGTMPIELAIFSALVKNIARAHKKIEAGVLKLLPLF
jgi:hypothetical protein